MKKNLVCALVTLFRYIAVIVAIVFLNILFDIMAGRDTMRYLGSTYLTVAVTGLAVSAISGYLYPSLLALMIKSYEVRYPDLEQRYVAEICRGKLLGIYFLTASVLCFACSFFYDMERYSLIVCAFMGGGFTFLFQYMKYRKQYKDL